MNNYRDVIKAPIITEKANDMQSNDNTFAFKVAIDANKTQIKQAIENIFKVKVTKVNTVNVRSKRKNVRGLRGKVGKTARYKKAYVTLTEDSKLEF